jgi:hypothetical protein
MTVQALQTGPHSADLYAYTILDSADRPTEQGSDSRNLPTKLCLVVASELNNTCIATRFHSGAVPIQ